MTYFSVKFLKIILYLLVMLLLFEGWHRSSMTEVFSWILREPFAFLFNFATIFTLYFLFKGTFGRTRIALWLVSILGLIFYTVSRQKLNMKGEPLYPWDFTLGNEAANIKEYFDIFSSRTEILLLVLLGMLCLFVPLIFSNHKEALKRRVLLVMFPIVFGLFLFMWEGSDTVHWHKSISYQKNGVLIGVISAAKEMKPKPPENYSTEVLHELHDRYKPVEMKTDVKPNLIFVMNEAFWDPTRLENLMFNEDPLPFFRQLYETETSGELLVPVLGGSTANTEFEVLTGNSMNFLPQGSLAYAQFIKKSHPSLASILQDQGYRTIAIHTYLDWFYQRDFVYQQFGFDQFISSKDFEDPKLRRGFIADNEMSQRIIAEHQQSDNPLFIFAVTMQNHSPFNLNHYDEDRITVNGPLSDPLKQKVNTYSTGVKDADDSLKMLVEYFNEVDEPTVIVYFGDHLPLLGEVYSDTQYIHDQNLTHWSKEEYVKMYTVPFVVWDNFHEAKEQGLYMNSSFLGAYTLERYGLPQTSLMKFLNDIIREDQPIFSVNNEASMISNPYRETYELFQYHQLFGE
ncbi:LTA synthase family protein [Anaerobacillus alkaliphilus]|uniref:LTA synthase family protein n=1 Tax=Anaerobacillus alkaliphilus TaxID=1548597 RepID=A0A4Q0VVC7_9BACI|nr:LTA synthase family protein [Anaerobacillus alkaliphilus]RXJ00687.1 LTA synthase family protein [Anaerobacillus alkaliphilus]